MLIARPMRIAPPVTSAILLEFGLLIETLIISVGPLLLVLSLILKRKESYA